MEEVQGLIGASVMEILGWLFFSIVVGIWNQRRGNSFWAGFLISLVLSPLIGFLFVLFTKKNAKAIEDVELASGEMKRCPFCAELIKAEAKKCRFCGSDF